MAKNGTRQVRAGRRRTDPRDVSDIAARLTKLAESVRASQREAMEIRSAAATCGRAAATSSASVREALGVVRGLGAAGGDIADAVAFVGGRAALTDLLRLNTDIEAVIERSRQLVFESDGDAPDASAVARATRQLRDLAEETIHAAEVIALRIGILRQEASNAVRTLLELQESLADLTTNQEALAYAADRQLDSQEATITTLSALSEALLHLPRDTTSRTRNPRR